MSNRRKPRQDRRAEVAAARREMEGMEPWLWALQDADEAERRGDAAGALEAVRRRDQVADGRSFWRPSRVRWLEQLVMLGPAMPGWVRSRWILEQALQWVDHDQGPRGRGGLSDRAVDVAVGIRGGWDRVQGLDAQDRRVKVMDHDWVYRQVFLYEQEGLARFLRLGATPDLVGGADRIDEWALAPMGGFEFLGHDGDILVWARAGSAWELDSERESVVSTPNIGTGFVLEPGDFVLGRLVPAADGVVFDGPVLAVPRQVALDVEQAPPRWVEVLRGAADDVRAGRIEPHQGAWRGIVSDIPIRAVDLMLHDLDGGRDPEAAAAVPPEDKAREVIERAAMVRTRAILLAAVAMQDDEDLSDEFADLVEGQMDMVALIHGALSDPAIVEALPDVVESEDYYVLEHLTGLLAEPARSFAQEVLAFVDPPELDLDPDFDDDFDVA